MIKFKGLFKVGAFVLALLALMVISSNGAKAQYSGTNGRIFFVGGNSHLLYSIFPDSSDLYSHGDMDPCTRFLSVFQYPTDAKVAIVRVSGTDPCRIYQRSVLAGNNGQPPSSLDSVDTATTTHFHPVYSHDGSKIAYLKTGFTDAGDPDYCDKQLYVANADGSGTPKQLTNFDYGSECLNVGNNKYDSGLNYPVWSNDSEKIYMHYKVYDTPECPFEDPCDPATGTWGIVYINTDFDVVGTSPSTYIGNVFTTVDGASVKQGAYATLAGTDPPNASSYKAFDGNGMDISPDNSNIVFANNGSLYIQSISTFTNGAALAAATKKTDDVDNCPNPSSSSVEEAYYSPHYSPDGKYVAATRFCGLNGAITADDALMIFDVNDFTNEQGILLKNSDSSTYVNYGYTLPFWSNITTTYNSTPTPSPTPAAPAASGSALKQRDIRLPMMLVLMGLVVLSASGYGIYKEAKRRKKV